jgi:hypothetical protein
MDNQILSLKTYLDSYLIIHYLEHSFLNGNIPKTEAGNVQRIPYLRILNSALGKPLRKAQEPSWWELSGEL